MRHEQRISRAYGAELAIAIAVYAVLLVGAITLARPLPDSVWRTALLLSPMLGFGLMIRAIARHLRRIDEYVRGQLLETIALAAAVTAALSFSYGFLETAGFPRLSMFTVWMVLAGATGIIALVRKALGR